MPKSTHSPGGGMTVQEAMQIEQEAHTADLRRQREAIAKKQRMGLPIKGEVLSRAEQEARIWAFMCVA
jgi:hypothetical protein